MQDMIRDSMEAQKSAGTQDLIDHTGMEVVYIYSYRFKLLSLRLATKWRIYRPCLARLYGIYRYPKWVTYEIVYLELLFIYLTAALGPLGWIN